MNYYGFVWIIMDLYGLLWSYVDYYGFYGFVWIWLSWASMFDEQFYFEVFVFSELTD